MTSLTRISAIVAVLACASTLVLHSCGDPYVSPPPLPVPVDLNIIVLLDLSDRISPEKRPAQAGKDKTIIRDLVNSFENRVRQQLYVASRDKLRIAIAQQVASGYDPAQFADKLSIDMQKIYEGGRPAFDGAKGGLLSGVDELYELATATVHYTGANIPLFFRDHLAGYVDKPEPGRRIRSIVIIVKDGYVELDSRIKLTLRDSGNRTTDMRLSQFRALPNWELVFDKGNYGLIVDRNNEFRGMEALVLEINLDPRHQDDKQLLFKYWLKWLGEMGFGKTELDMTEDSSRLTADRVDKFLRSE